jgi:hypothetical protein
MFQSLESCTIIFKLHSGDFQPSLHSRRSLFEPYVEPGLYPRIPSVIYGCNLLIVFFPSNVHHDLPIVIIPTGCLLVHHPEPLRELVLNGPYASKVLDIIPIIFSTHRTHIVIAHTEQSHQIPSALRPSSATCFPLCHSPTAQKNRRNQSHHCRPRPSQP